MDLLTLFKEYRLNFQRFFQKSEVQNFLIKREGLVSWGYRFEEKLLSLNIANYSFLKLSLSTCDMCVLLIYIISMIFFAFHRKTLVSFILISRYMTYKNNKFLKSRSIVNICKVNFCISKLFIQCSAGNCSVHITSV